MIQIWKAIGRSVLSGPGSVGVSSQTARPFSVLTTRILTSQESTTAPLPFESTLLQPSLNTSSGSGTAGTLVPVRGMKIKAKVYHRCRDCYFQYSMGTLYNLCRTHGRHKQMLKPKYWVNQRIITAVSQKPRKPW